MILIKKEMSENVEETTIKLLFDGTENIFEVKDKLDKMIADNKDKKAKLAKIVSKTISDIGKINLTPLILFHPHLPSYKNHK